LQETFVEQVAASDVVDITVPADFNRLSGEQIERLIARHKAPALWSPEQAPFRPPEPFGMIA
jgi:hypothetical protein